MAAYRQVYDSVNYRLTAKDWDQLQNPTLGSRLWATFTFTLTDCVVFAWLDMFENICYTGWLIKMLPF